MSRLITGCILSVLLILCTMRRGEASVISGVTIDDEMQRILLDRHNKLRNDLALNGISGTNSKFGDGRKTSNQPSATYMNQLHYDPALAATAQSYTNRCNSGHNYNRKSDFKGYGKDHATFVYDDNELSVGENFLYYPRTNGKTIYQDAADFAEEHWWDEHFDYNYQYDSCSGVCGHYTQMAWADTRYVGCGATLCSDNGYQYLFLICNYYPSGNFYGKKAYPQGTPCSDCLTRAPDRDKCDGSSSGLCTGCQAKYWDYCSDIFTNCDDLSSSCPGASSCQADPSNYYCNYCRRSCSTCTTAQLSPLPTCNDNFDGLSPVVIPTAQPTGNTPSPTEKPTPPPVPTSPPIPTSKPTSPPTPDTSGIKVVNGIRIDLDIQKILLDRHNQLRNDLALNGLSGTNSKFGDGRKTTNQPSATFMNKLHFDPALAATAQQFTNKCRSGHNNNRVNEFKTQFGDFSAFYYDSDSLSLGENYLYYPTYGKSIADLAPDFAEEHWWDEHFDYNYQFDSCSGVCGHYTQMAWADTRYVGCGATLCDDPNGYEYLFLICNYYPSGNFYGKKAYPSGTPCTECATKASDRDVCDGRKNGLCDGCQSLWWNYCDDKWTNCDELTCPAQYLCQSDPANNFPCPNCKRKCGTCTDAQLQPEPKCNDKDEGFGTSSTDTTTTTTTKAATTTTTTSTTTTTTTTTTKKPKPTTTTTTTTDGGRWQTWTCDRYRQCYNYPIVCPEGKHCEVYCKARQTCRGATIQCAAGKKCNVYCSGDAACLDLTIYGETASDVNINTDGGYRAGLTEGNNVQAFTAEDETGAGSTSWVVAVLSIVLVLCLCILIGGWCLHKRKINKLEERIEKLGGTDKSIQMTNVPMVEAEVEDEENDEPEIEVSLKMNDGDDATQTMNIVPDDSD